MLTESHQTKKSAYCRIYLYDMLEKEKLIYWDRKHVSGYRGEVGWGSCFRTEEAIRQLFG